MIRFKNYFIIQYNVYELESLQSIKIQNANYIEIELTCMLYLTKKEIDKKFFQVISSYEKVLSSLKENKYSDISYNLDNIRFLNSEIQCMVKEFAILDKNKSFKSEIDFKS